MYSVAVDVNPAESALLELKIAAIKHLSYEDYLLVLGDKEDTLSLNKRCKMIVFS
jgi:S-adenosylmethionine:diacylglycerol 3-amino-3-carboxypropyl transferase